MKIRFNHRKRSDQKEIMDDLSFSGDEMRSLLKDLSYVNRWLGGNKSVIDGIRKLLNDVYQLGVVRILDIGCGDGAQLRACAAYFKEIGWKAEFTGIDANPHIIQEAINASEGMENMKFIHANIFDMNSTDLGYDIVICNLFLHHLSNQEIVALLRKLKSSTKLGVIINDLHRSKLAFVLFKFVSILLLQTRVARIDGLISIARGFRKQDFDRIDSELNLNSSLKWKWAFRYLWIINTQYERQD